MTAIACELCGRGCNGIAQLISHIELRHPNERQNTNMDDELNQLATDLLHDIDFVEYDPPTYMAWTAERIEIVVAALSVAYAAGGVDRWR